MWGPREKAVICKPGRESSPDTLPAGTFILDFQPPELSENQFLLVKAPGLWYSAMEAQAD